MTMTFLTAKRLVIGFIILALAACTQTETANKAPDPLGDFKLGYAIVVAKNAQKGPLSRSIDPAEIKAALQPKLEKSLSVYQGSRLYHVAVAVDAYILAVPGIPLVASPKSALIISVDVWDDQKQAKVMERKQITVMEKISGKSFFGSGLTQNKQQQLDSLTTSAVKQVEIWLRKNEALFAPDVVDAPVDAPVVSVVPKT
jgi:hypothetical protein